MASSENFCHICGFWFFEKPWMKGNCSSEGGRSSSTSSARSSRRKGRSSERKVYPWKCECGCDVVRLTSKTENNPGRVFFCCEKQEGNFNHFFKWFDEVMEDKMDNFDEGLERVLMDTEAYKLRIGKMEIELEEYRVKTRNLEVELEEYKEKTKKLEDVLEDYKGVMLKFVVVVVVVVMMHLKRMY
ncbi:PREDICTED: uncharacterized protein At4g04775-like [Tarenaya hassleriana]|uniref:uncharacterized protein At4g04775-like n=1 Tax=Tarenaya hassleriana TaxID=28532 RepID=UPI00053C99CB|nr:PREDICTED: uncharacterized protein At4g04775-like [Tarenaya hassleriana]